MEAEFEKLLAGFRPRLHRYCARMTGSAIDGEDIVQEVLLKALDARAAGVSIANLHGWLYRVAHNASLDFMRKRARMDVVELTEDMAADDHPPPGMAAIGFRSFLRLPELQRCAVVLKDVLGHTVEEIAEIADCSVPAAKSALQRGRAKLRTLAAEGKDAHVPLLAPEERKRLAAFVEGFRAGDFDAIRRMLAEDVRLDLVNRLSLQGRDRIGMYFTRYGEATHWRFAQGAVDGIPAMLVFDAEAGMSRPAHCVLVDWRGGAIQSIRDFLFAPYVLEDADWVRTG